MAGSLPSIPARSVVARQSTIPGITCPCSLVSPAPCAMPLPSKTGSCRQRWSVCGAGELAPHTLHRCRQDPVFEGSGIAHGAGLTSEHGHVMPGIVDCLATTERAGMLGNDPAILADYDAIGIGMDLDRTSDRAGRHRVLVVVEANQTGLRDRCRHCVESIEPAGIGNELGPLHLEHRAMQE